MIKAYYAYKNDKVGYFTDPFTLPYADDDQVIEVCSRAVKSGQVQHAEELSLYHVYTMDDKNGEIVPGLSFIVSLSEFIDYGK